MDEQLIGPHLIRFEPPMLIYLALGGELSVGDAERLIAFVRERAAEQEALVVLMDVAQLPPLTSEVRRAVAHGSKNLHYGAVAVIHASLPIRTTIRVVVGAMALMNRELDYPLRFFPSEIEARVWLDQRQRQLGASSPQEPSTEPTT